MIYIKEDNEGNIKAFGEPKEGTIAITEEQWRRSDNGLYGEIDNNEFLIYTKPIEELKKIRIQDLKINCYNFIINKYPLFKQINLVNGLCTIQEKADYDSFVSIQRALCNAREQQILNATTVDEINEINIEFVDE